MFVNNYCGILELHSLHFCDWCFVHIQGRVEVGGAITCFKDGDQCRILLGVGVLGIHQLKVEFEGPAPLVSS